VKTAGTLLKTISITSPPMGNSCDFSCAERLEEGAGVFESVALDEFVVEVGEVVFGDGPVGILG